MASADKTLVLITGANSGIGFELAKQLLADASKHILLGCRNPSKGEKAVQDLQSLTLPGTVEFVQIDVSKQESIDAAAKHVQEKHGRLDVLVNNAGILPADHSATDIKTMVETFTTNAAGPCATVKAFEPLLSKASIPRIINVTSFTGSISARLDKSNSIYGYTIHPYRVSKAALNMVTANQFWEYAPKGWKVFLFCPGFTESNINPANKVQYGAKPVSVGTAPIVGMVNGERDADAGKFLTADTESGELGW